MAEKRLCLVPQPKQVSWGSGEFNLGVDTRIMLLPNAGQSEHQSARCLQQEIQAELGLRLPIVKLARPERTDNTILLISDLGAARAFWGQDIDPQKLQGHGEQAYWVHVGPGCVLAGGDSAEALHYAVQTMRQLLRIERGQWPALEIVDWPSLPYRGVMLDVCRGKVPTVETLEMIVDQLSLYKINVLQLYTEHTFVFPHHPSIGAGCGSLSSDDILRLDAYARARQVELMPNLQSFGHWAHILNLPEYAHLAESPIARWSLCPRDERVYDLLDDMYADLLPTFTSKTLNINCDETWDLGIGRSAQAVAELGIGRVYLEHILRLRELAQRYGCRIQLWGDILLHHPELVSELPDDVTLLDWHYEASDDYPSVRLFAESGREFWVCPGTSSWNTLFPRIDNANGNIRTLARLAAEHGGKGLLNTDWGDHGHYQPLGQCWYGYAYGAEQAWSGGATADETFESCFGPLFFGLPGAEVVATMRRLARLNTLPGMAQRNASRGIYALLAEPLVGEVNEQIPPETLDEIARTCAEAEQTLQDATAASRDQLSLQEMAYSARMLAYAAHKVRTSQQIKAELARLSDAAEAPARLRNLQGALRARELELVALTDEFRELWLRRARYSEIGITLGHFSRLRERLVKAQRWLEEKATQAESQGQLDLDLASYAAEAQSYEILGQGFWRRMREAGVRLR